MNSRITNNLIGKLNALSIKYGNDFIFTNGTSIDIMFSYSQKMAMFKISSVCIYRCASAINDFIACSATGFGILESRDKFKLLTKEKTLPGALKELAKKHAKRNVLIGLGIGALYAIIDMALMKKFSPNLEKMYDKLDEIEKSKKTEDKV